MAATVFQRRRWTPRDSVCFGLAVLVVITVAMCLWVAAISMSIARHQANEILDAVERSSVIEFNLTVQATAEFPSGVMVTGRLHPRYSECTGQLGFDGQMVVTSLPYYTSEEFTLINHRGYRRPTNESGANTTCLTTQDIPPLHTIQDTARSALTPIEFYSFGVKCSKPIQFSYYDMPFAVCAEDWLRARNRVQVVNPITNSSDSRDHGDRNPLLVIYGKKSLLEARLLPSATYDQVFASNESRELSYLCEYLEAPMTTGECPSD